MKQAKKKFGGDKSDGGAWCNSYQHHHKKRKFNLFHSRNQIFPQIAIYYFYIDIWHMRTINCTKKIDHAVEQEFYFPGPLNEGEEKPAIWTEIEREHQGADCVFPY